jgi:hypothetical protein
MPEVIAVVYELTDLVITVVSVKPQTAHQLQPRAIWPG